MNTYAVKFYCEHYVPWDNKWLMTFLSSICLFKESEDVTNDNKDQL